MKTKLCGFREEKTLQIAIKEKCDFVGFVFYKNSPRFISVDDASRLAKIVPSSIAKVAVIVDVDLNFLTEIAVKISPQFFQFHGSETPEFLSEVRKKFPNIKIIKAFAISQEKDLEEVKNFNEVADLFLFDGKNAGGGKVFDWKILQNLVVGKDWFLSGGLNAGNILDAFKATKAKMIDVSSGIEEIKGQKSIRLIHEFMAIAKKIC